MYWKKREILLGTTHHTHTHTHTHRHTPVCLVLRLYIICTDIWNSMLSSAFCPLPHTLPPGPLNRGNYGHTPAHTRTDTHTHTHAHTCTHFGPVVIWWQHAYCVLCYSNDWLLKLWHGEGWRGAGWIVSWDNPTVPPSPPPLPQHTPTHDWSQLGICRVR